MALYPYNETYAEKNLDAVEALAVKPELTLVFIGPPRYTAISGKDIIDAAAVVNFAAGIINNAINIDSGKFKLLGAVMSYGFSLSSRQMPIKPLGANTLVLESADTTEGSLELTTLVVPENIIKKIKNTYYAEGSLGESVANIISNVTSQAVNLKGQIQYDLTKMRKPFGVLVLEMNKSYNTPIGAHYFEMCKIQGVSKGVQAGNALVIDRVSIVFHRIREVLN